MAMAPVFENQRHGFLSNLSSRPATTPKAVGTPSSMKSKTTASHLFPMSSMSPSSSASTCTSVEAGSLETPYDYKYPPQSSPGQTSHYHPQPHPQLQQRQLPPPPKRQQQPPKQKVQQRSPSSSRRRTVSPEQPRMRQQPAKTGKLSNVSRHDEERVKAAHDNDNEYHQYNNLKKSNGLRIQTALSPSSHADAVFSTTPLSANSNITLFRHQNRPDQDQYFRQQLLQRPQAVADKTSSSSIRQASPASSASSFSSSLSPRSRSNKRGAQSSSTTTPQSAPATTTPTSRPHNLYMKSMQFVAERKERKLKEQKYLTLAAACRRESPASVVGPKAQIPPATATNRRVSSPNEQRSDDLNIQSDHDNDLSPPSPDPVRPTSVSCRMEAASSSSLPEISTNSPDPTKLQQVSSHAVSPSSAAPTTLSMSMLPPQQSAPPLHNIIVKKKLPSSSYPRTHTATSASSSISRSTPFSSPTSSSTGSHLLNQGEQHPSSSTSNAAARMIRVSSNNESSRRRKEARFKELSRRAELYHSKRVARTVLIAGGAGEGPPSSSNNNKYHPGAVFHMMSRAATPTRSCQSSSNGNYDYGDGLNGDEDDDEHDGILQSSSRSTRSGFSHRRHPPRSSSSSSRRGKRGSSKTFARVQHNNGGCQPLELLFTASAVESPFHILMATANCNYGNGEDINGGEDSHPANGRKLIAIKRSTRDELLQIRDKIRRAKVTKDVSATKDGSLAATTPGKRVVQFCEPMVTDVKERPYTSPEEIDDLYFGEEELNELECDRATVEGDQFELIAVPAGTSPEDVVASLTASYASPNGIHNNMVGSVGGSSSAAVSGIISRDEGSGICVHYKNKMDGFVANFTPAVEDDHLIPLSASDLSALCVVDVE